MIAFDAIFGLALLKALSILALLSCLNFYRVLGYDFWVDLFIGLVLLILYAGSAHGILIATLSGVVVSFVLRALRWLVGYERWSFKRMRWEYYP